MSTLKGKTLFITGATRGIGKAIALRAARDGANIVVAAKSTTAHPKLPGTIFSAAEEIEAAGGQALAVPVDVRDDDQIQRAVDQTVEVFGGIDICINNASAISLTPTLQTEMKRFDLMHQVNTRGTFAVSRACLPHLLKAENPHILNMAPPLNMSPKWFAGYGAYTMAKYGMSMCVLGMAEEFKSQGVAVNALWPKTIIGTAALQAIGPMAPADHGRTPEIMADAAHAVLVRNSRDCTGNFLIDEEVLREDGVTDFEGYAVKPGNQLIPDLFLD